MPIDTFFSMLSIFHFSFCITSDIHCHHSSQAKRLFEFTFLFNINLEFWYRWVSEQKVPVQQWEKQREKREANPILLRNYITKTEPKKTYANLFSLMNRPQRPWSERTHRSEVASTQLCAKLQRMASVCLLTQQQTTNWQLEREKPDLPLGKFQWSVNLHTSLCHSVFPGIFHIDYCKPCFSCS